MSEGHGQSGPCVLREKRWQTTSTLSASISPVDPRSIARGEPRASRDQRPAALRHGCAAIDPRGRFDIASACEQRRVACQPDGLPRRPRGRPDKGRGG
jgi:hypothetical protein